MENIYTNFDYSKLEFNKILTNVATYALSEEGRKNIINTIPGTSIEHIRQQHQTLSELVNFFYKEEKLTIDVIYNFGKQLVNASKNIVLDAIPLYELCYSVQLYFAVRKRFNKPQYQQVYTIFRLEKLDTKFYEEVLRYIDPEGYVDSRASKELKEIRINIANVESKIRKNTDTFIKYAKEHNYIADDIVTFRDGFTCVAVKSNLKNRIDGIVLDYSATGQTAFVVPRKVVELSNELLHLQDEEKKEIYRILKRYTEEIKLYEDDLKIIDDDLLIFDIIHTKARYSHINSLFSPIISDEPGVEIVDGKHPLLGDGAVPLNAEIGKNFKILVVTGPNTGGKTVALKTIGLFSLMVQSGIPIPASSASKFCIFNKLFIDIGDDQSIEQSLSTFSGHIKKIIEIVNNADEKSLVLVDEFGAGTDPIEGSALAMSLMHTLRELKSIVLITTHYTALKHYAAQEDLIENGSMEFDADNLQPTYRLNIGIPGSSKALEISKRLGMPDAIIYRAKFNMDKDYLNVEKLTERLENEKIKARELKDNLINRERLLEQKLAQIEEERDAIKAREKELKILIKRQESDFLKESRKEFENLVRLIKTKGAKKEYIMQGKKLFDEIDGNIKIVEKQERELEKKIVVKELPPELKVGDDIKIISKNVRGTIVGRTNNKDEFMVQAGLLKLNIPASDLKLVNVKQQQNVNTYNYSYVSNARPELTLDVRGCRYDEAERKVDKFVEQAIANKMNTIKVIHGMGTGAIRKCIHDFFTNSPYILDFHYEKLAGSDSTNFGTTVANLRI